MASWTPILFEGTMIIYASIKNRYWKAGQLKDYYSCYQLENTEVGVVWVYCYTGYVGRGYILPAREIHHYNHFTYCSFKEADLMLDRYDD